MAVPELQMPSVQSEATPTPQAVPVNVGSAGEVGAGIGKVGDALFQEGYREYHLAAETFAQQKENQFQDQALVLRDKYKNLFGDDAVKAHSDYSAELTKLRDTIGKTINSKYGFNLFDNGSRRNARFVQESMDSHFETQDRVFQDKTYKTAQFLDTKALASFAAQDDYNPALIEEKIRGIGLRAARRAERLGLDPSDFAKQAIGTSLDGLFDVLGARKDPELLKAEYEKYNAKDLLDKSQQIKVMTQIHGSEAQQTAVSVMAATPRVNAAGSKALDVDARIDESAARAALQERMQGWEPAKQDAALHEFDFRMKEETRRFQDTVKQKVEKIKTQGQTGETGGVQAFRLDPVAMAKDLAWLNRNAPTEVTHLIDLDTKSGRNAYSAQHRVDAANNNRNLLNLQDNLVDLAVTDPARFKKLTPTDVARMVQDTGTYRGGFTFQGTRQAETALKMLQEREQKGDVSKIGQAVGQLVGELYSGNKAKRAKARATDFAISEIPKGTPPDKARAMVKEFLAGAWEDYSPETAEDKEVRQGVKLPKPSGNATLSSQPQKARRKFTVGPDGSMIEVK